MVQIKTDFTKAELELIINGYVRKEYASIKKENTEIYSILHNKTIKKYLRQYINKVCKNIKNKSKLKINEGSLLISKALINRKLNKYINENIPKI